MFGTMIGTMIGYIVIATIFNLVRFFYEKFFGEEKGFREFVTFALILIMFWVLWNGVDNNKIIENQETIIEQTKQIEKGEK